MSVIVPDRPVTINVAHPVTVTPASPVLVRAHARRRPAMGARAQVRAEMDAEMISDIAILRAKYATALMPNGGASGYIGSELRGTCARLAAHRHNVRPHSAEAHAIGALYAPEAY